MAALVVNTEQIPLIEIQIYTQYIKPYLQNHEVFLVEKVVPRLRRINNIFKRNRISKIIEKLAMDNWEFAVFLLLKKYDKKHINMKLILRGFAYAGNLVAIKKLLIFDHKTTENRKRYYGTIECALTGALANNQVNVAEELIKFPKGFVEIKDEKELPSYRHPYYMANNFRICFLIAKKQNAVQSIKWLQQNHPRECNL